VPANRDSGPRQPANGNGSKPGPPNGHPTSRQNGNRYRATTRQLDYAGELAKQTRGVGKRGLEQLAQKMFGEPVAELSGIDASGLIDTLKAIKAGEIDVDQALSITASIRDHPRVSRLPARRPIHHFGPDCASCEFALGLPGMGGVMSY
jgi:hypothetical protein